MFTDIKLFVSDINIFDKWQKTLTLFFIFFTFSFQAGFICIIFMYIVFYSYVFT